MNERARFIVTFTPMPGVNGVRALRLLLKSARRRFGLVAVDAHETAPAPDISNQIADAFAGLRRDVRNRIRERS
jgi:arginase family enzyme